MVEVFESLDLDNRVLHLVPHELQKTVDGPGSSVLVHGIGVWAEKSNCGKLNDILFLNQVSFKRKLRMSVNKPTVFVYECMVVW